MAGLVTDVLAETAVGSAAVQIRAGTDYLRTASNVAVQSAPTLWLVTAKPMNTSLAIVIDSVPTIVHAAPSDDSYALNVEPVRTSFTHNGGWPVDPLVLRLVAPVATRR